MLCKKLCLSCRKRSSLVPRKRQVGGGDGAPCLAVAVFIQCVYVCSASVCMGQAVGTQAAADSHPQMSPAAGDASRGMKGWSRKARRVGKHLGWNHVSLFFWPLRKQLSFAVSAPQWQWDWIKSSACPQSTRILVRSPTQGISRSKATELARPEDNKGEKSSDIYISKIVGYFLHSVKVNMNVIWSGIFFFFFWLWKG